MKDCSLESFALRCYQSNALPDAPNTPEKPVIFLGWVVSASEGPIALKIAETAMTQLLESLEQDFPMFDWRTELVSRRLTREGRQQDPLQLLQIGVQEKVARPWDFAFVASLTELKARRRPFTLGVPSSALETAVIALQAPDNPTTASIDPAAVARFMLASMLGLISRAEGAMRPPNIGEDYRLEAFSPDQLKLIEERLMDIGDERLEESHRRLGRAVFRLSAFAADPKGVLLDVIGYRPWKQPFRLGRLTAAAFLSSLLSFLGAEVWELGAHIEPWVLIIGTLLSIWISAWFLKRGQGLAEVTRYSEPSEQVVRTEWVLGICLIVGMTSLWLMLLIASFTITSLLPRDVIEAWINADLDFEAKLRFSAFVSTLGTLAGALGGNLEDEGEFKAQFFFDEEI